MTPTPVLRIGIHRLPARAGLDWIRSGWAAFRRQPFGFLGLFGMFLMLVIVSSLPIALLAALADALNLQSGWLGLLGVGLLPLVSIGFMTATQAAQQGVRIRPQFLFVGLARPGLPRRALLWLALAYVLVLLLAAFAGNDLDGGEAQRWLGGRMTAPGPDGSLEVVDLSQRAELVLWLKAAVVALGSIPLWHAPALVHWGGQGVRRALFGSIVALWRTRGAFMLFMAGWFLIGLASTMVLGALSLLLPPLLLGLLAVFNSWVLSAAFYASLWSGFTQTFDIRPPSE